jgi:hypothetical protein
MAERNLHHLTGHDLGRFRADGNRLEPEQIPDRRACMHTEVAGAATTIGAEDGSRHARKMDAFLLGVGKQVLEGIPVVQAKQDGTEWWRNELPG